MLMSCLLPAGKCILEWDGAEGEKPPVPLLKNMFANERRKAKVCLLEPDTRVHDLRAYNHALTYRRQTQTYNMCHRC